MNANSVDLSIKSLSDILQPGRRILVAVSGGPDSLALLHALYSHKLSLNIEAVAVAHYDHGLRPESASEAEFVEEYCRTLNIPCFAGRSPKGSLSTAGQGSLQNSAREARYAFIDKAADNYRADLIATGHHRDDQIETILINILRGTGIDGLRGIPFQRGRYIRPFLNVSRLEIESYCAKHGLEPRRDLSNNDPSHYLRNKIRLDLLPMLTSDYHPGAGDALLRLAENAAIDCEYLDIQTETALNSCLAGRRARALDIDITKLLSHHASLRRRVLRLAVSNARGSRDGLSEEHVRKVLAFCEDAGLPGSISIPNPLIRVTRRGSILTVECPETFQTAVYSVLLQDIPENRAFDLPNGWQVIVRPNDDAIPYRTRPSIHDDKFLAVIDANTVDISSIHIRPWRPGDKIDPIGMGGKTKKIQDIFVDAKLPAKLRATWPMVAGDQGVIWIPGIALSERMKIDEKSSKRLEMLFLPAPFCDSVDLVEP